MDLRTFILSKRKAHRIRRHILFWLAWWLYFAITHAAAPFGGPEIQYFNNALFTFTEAIFLVVSQMPLVYATVYFVLPKFILKGRYVWAACFMLLFWAVGGLYHFYLMTEFLPWVTRLLLPPESLPLSQRPVGVSFFMAVLATYKGALTITAIAFMMKFAKYWYLKEQSNLLLQKQNTEAQLRLLTAQIHPHFMFNTLNNIYSQAQKESPKSAKMIMGLSDMLRYILYEGQKEKVLLEKELQMIIEYMELEEVRYGNKLEMHYRITDKTDGVMIAPLLLLPFVENCFKHGASHLLQNPWINFTVEMNDGMLVMKLMNAKSNSPKAPQQQGIGINNVRQRLELLYPGRHELQIRDEADVFVVDLKIVLDTVAQSSTVITSPVSTVSYA